MDRKYFIVFMYICLVLLTEVQPNCSAKDNQYIDVQENSYTNMNVNPKKLEYSPYRDNNLRFDGIYNKWYYPEDTKKGYPRVSKNLQERKTYHRFKRPYLPLIRIKAYPAYIKLENKNTNMHNHWKNIGNQQPERYYHRLLESHYLRVMRK